MIDDTIKRSDAIKALCDAVDAKKYGEYLYTDEFCKVINAIPSADRQQEWIPCSERVPIEYRTVLVTWEYAGKSYTTTAFRKTKNAVTYWASNEQPKYTPLKVVAWMPLPEPWKGADDEGV